MLTNVVAVTRSDGNDSSRWGQVKLAYSLEFVSLHEYVPRWARMAKKGADVGLQVGWQSDKTDPLTREKLYGVRDSGTGQYDYDRIRMTVVEYARLLRDARAAAEQWPAATS